MKKTAFAFVYAAALWSAPASAQSLRIEAEAGAATLLRIAVEEFAAGRGGAAAPVRVEIGTTRAALRKVCAGELAGAGIARAGRGEAPAACAPNTKVTLREIPLAVDAVVAVVNPANGWAKAISLEELRRGWLEAPGKAGSWRAVNAQWPDRALKLYGPGTNLGLAAYYRSALASGSAGAELRRDYTATDVLPVVVDAVARDLGGLGILDWSTYSAQQKRVRALAVQVDGKPLQPTLASLRDGSYGALSYRISLQASEAALGNAVFREFVGYVLANAERLAEKAAVAPLAASDYAAARKALDAK